MENMDKEMVLKMAFWILMGLISPVVEGAEKDESITVNKPVIGSSADTQPWIHFSPGNVRCFCNLPQCISTGYMCKSSAGGCFSDVLDHLHPRSTAYRGRHGCLELLPNKDQRPLCQNNPVNDGKSNWRRKDHQKSLLLCCYHDMCNHADNPETKTLLNMNSNILDESSNEGKDKLVDNFVDQQESGYANSDVWFKAATIFVPICGAVILFVLIALAIRLLRAESAYNSADYKLGPNAYHQRHNHAQNTYNFERDGPYNCNYENILFNQVLPYPHDMVHNSSKDHDQRHASVPLLRQNSDIAPTGNDKQYSVKLNVLEREAECMLVPDKLYELQKYVHISDKNDLSQNSINANQK